MTTRWNVARDRNVAAVDAVAAQALTECRFDSLRTRRARGRLVRLQMALIVVTPLAWVFTGPLSGVALVIVTLAGLFFLRRSVRVIADLPDRMLDERQRSARNASYVDAYRVLAGFVMLLAIVGLFAFILQADGHDIWQVDLGWSGMMAIFWTLELVALSLPSMVIALREGDELRIDPNA